MTDEEMLMEAERLLRKKYVVHQDDRQKSLDVSYITAETRDLAKTVLAMHKLFEFFKESEQMDE